ncbi:nucleotide-binding protein [Devosia sp.]|uniref:nucleotide-binding protein n=1 Tax=Devosia sp. TaxID=1871048 RepID=UPI001B0CCA2C|nr:nucleotide-binding protein [Devosia sp.]MBO9587961.1 nucleotide-binding protein [Devosia sp.]
MIVVVNSSIEVILRPNQWGLLVKRDKLFYGIKFPIAAIREASDLVNSLFESNEQIITSYEYYRIYNKEESWHHDDEDEFFADYNKCSQKAVYSREFKGTIDGAIEKISLEVSLSLDGGTSEVGVQASRRWIIERVLSKFDAWESRAEKIIGYAENFSIFVGHGRSPQWRDLKDHLSDQHHFDVVAYETGARAGHSIRDILGEMVDNTSFALLVMTAEDASETREGRARQNVVHEIGLFQGRLGFARAIALVEDGVELFSNLDGVQQIRFSKGNIRETFGDVLATIRREFGRGILRDDR